MTDCPDEMNAPNIENNKLLALLKRSRAGEAAYQDENKKLHGLLKQCLVWVEGAMPPAPDHICGSESDCDDDCMAYANADGLRAHLIKVAK